VKVNNPFWSYPSVRVKIDDDRKKTMIFGSQKVIELPEDAQIAVIEPIDGGRSDSPAICEPAIWTPQTGVMSEAGFKEAVSIMEQKKKLQEEKDAAAARKAKEARERGNQKKAVSEKPKKVVEEKTGEKTCGPKIRLDDDLDMGKKLEL
jgi:hypothetical protein